MATQLQDNTATPFREDKGLIVLVPVQRPMRWVTLFSVSLAIMAAAYLIATYDLRRVPDIPAVTTDEEVNQKALRYVIDANASVVILGSSLAERLDERYFTIPEVRNLALSGGSPLTGLKLVAQLSHVPEIVVVETNVLDRPTDNALIDRFKPSIPAIDRLEILLGRLKPLRIAVHWWLNGWPSDNEQRRSYAREALKLRVKQPQEYDTRAAIQKTLSQWSTRDWEGLARANAAEMMRIVHELECRGTKVFFVDLPFSPELHESSYATGTRRIMEEANGAEDRWLQLRMDTAQLRWKDGAHLDKRSTILVIDAIERALGARAGDQTPPHP